jgi:hypothetical protein
MEFRVYAVDRVLITARNAKSMENDVRAVVENYVSGVTKPDVELLRSAFRPDAHMWGHLGGTAPAFP